MLEKEKEHKTHASCIYVWANCFSAFLCKDIVCPNLSLLRDGVQALPPVSRAHPQGSSSGPNATSQLSKSPEQPFLQFLQVGHSQNFLEKQNDPKSLTAFRPTEKTISAHQALLHTKASRKEMPFLQEKKRQIGKQGSSAHFGKRNSQGLAQLLLASLISRKSGIQTQNGQREGARTASLRNCSLVPALFGYASLKPCGWSQFPKCLATDPMTRSI